MENDLKDTNGAVCSAHVELVESMGSLCTSIKWMVRLGFFLAPFIMMFGAYVMIQMVDLKTTVSINAYRLEILQEELVALKGK